MGDRELLECDAAMESSQVVAAPAAPTTCAARYRAEPARDVGRFGNTYFRWTLFHSFIVLGICGMPLWLSAVIPRSIVYVNTCLSAFFAFMWLWIAINAVRNFRRLLGEGLSQNPVRENPM